MSNVVRQLIRKAHAELKAAPSPESAAQRSSEPPRRSSGPGHGTDTVRPVDFHSWRRALNQALADAGTEPNGTNEEQRIASASWARRARFH